MHDELLDWQPADISRVTLEDPWELDYWMNHFQVNGHRLRKAVAAVGSHRDDVLANLAGSRTPA